MKNVFSYSDYRTYLAHYYIDRKRNRVGYSYEVFSVESGIKSANYLKLVIDGKRNLSGALIFKFAKGLGLDGLELDFFEILVRANQSEAGDERKFYQQRLKKFRRNLSEVSTNVMEERIRFDWYAPVAAVVLSGQQIGGAQERLSKHLNVSEKNANIIIDNLLKHSLILMSDKNTYELSNDFSFFKDRSKNRYSYKQYIHDHLEYSHKNLDSLYKNGKFICHSFTTDPSQVEELYRIISEFLLRFNKGCVDNNKQEAFQLNLQMYPWS